MNTICLIGQSTSSLMLDSLLSINENPGYQILIDELEVIKGQSLIDEDTLVLSKCLLYQTSFYSKLSDYSNQSRTTNESIKIASDTSVVPVSLYVSILNNAAALEKLKGNHVKANEMYYKILDLEKNTSNRSGKLSRYYYNLALNYITIGDYTNALTTIEESIKYAKIKKTDFLDLEKAQLTKGVIYTKLNDHRNAIEHIRISLKSKEKENRDWNRFSINAHQELAQAYLNDDQLEKSIATIAKASKKQIDLDYRIYKTIEIESQILEKKRDYSASISLMKKSIDNAKQKYTSNKEYPVIARLYKSLGDLYLSHSMQDSSLVAYQNGLTYFDPLTSDDLKENPNPKNLEATTQALDLLHAKAKVSFEIYQKSKNDIDFEVSYNAYKSAISLIDVMKQDFFTNASKFYVAENFNAIYQEALELLSVEYGKTNNSQLVDEIFVIIEKNKSSILFNNVKNKYDLISSNLPRSILDAESELKTNISFYGKLLSQERNKESKDSLQIEKLKSSLFEANEKYVQHKQTLSKDFPIYSEITNEITSEQSIKDIQNHLMPKTAIVEYFWGEENLYVLTILKNKTEFLKIKLETLEEGISNYSKLVSKKPTEKSSINKLKAVSNELYSSLISELTLNDITSLIIVPDGKLTQIPFESLLQNEDKGYLIESFNVCYFYSVKQYFTAKEPGYANNNILCLAPQFKGIETGQRSCENQDFGNLKYAKEEVLFISENFDGEVFATNSTNKAQLIDNIKNYPIIHLATHACLNQNDPMLSEIHFNDGAITNYDIQSTNVQPNFVVLSACNTGQGEIQIGEGIISLSRGFLEAGVQSLQSSLWSIDDYTSSEIIKGMYTNLKKGQNKSTSLRNSKLEFLATADNLRKHPYFWAGIVHIGNDYPLFPSNSNWKWILAIGLFLLIGFIFYRMLKSKSK